MIIKRKLRNHIISRRKRSTISFQTLQIITFLCITRRAGGITNDNSSSSRKNDPPSTHRKSSSIFLPSNSIPSRMEGVRGQKKHQDGIDDHNVMDTKILPPFLPIEQRPEDDDHVVVIDGTSEYGKVSFFWPSHDDTGAHVKYNSDAIAQQTELRSLQEEGNETVDDDNINEDAKPWGPVIGACLLVNLVTLVGIVTLVPAIGHRSTKLCCRAGKSKTAENTSTASADPGHNLLQTSQSRQQPPESSVLAASKSKRSNVLDIAIPSFACGALLATAILLIIPESIHLISNGIAERNNEGAAEDAAEDAGHITDHEDEEEGESEVQWRFGAALLGGFLLPIVLGTFFPRANEHECDERCAAVSNDVGDPWRMQQQEAGDAAETSVVVGTPDPSLSLPRTVIDDEEECASCLEEKTSEEETKSSIEVDMSTSNGLEQGLSSQSNRDISKPSPTEEECYGQDLHHRVEEVPTRPSKATSEYKTKVRSKNINYRLCASILIGDFFHNYADGIFIGVGFLLCSRDVAISIMAVTIYHEIAQEIADFFLLTRHANLRTVPALALNFVSGLSVLFGGITILAVGHNISDIGIGTLLDIAAGVYIQVAASECVPRIDLAVHNQFDRALSIFMFVAGAAPIGLVLLNHHHCHG